MLCFQMLSKNAIKLLLEHDRDECVCESVLADLWLCMRDCVSVNSSELVLHLSFFLLTLVFEVPALRFLLLLFNVFNFSFICVFSCISNALHLRCAQIKKNFLFNLESVWMWSLCFFAWCVCVCVGFASMIFSTKEQNFTVTV